mgnify:CR=1 FL=1
MLIQAYHQFFQGDDYLNISLSKCCEYTDRELFSNILLNIFDIEFNVLTTFLTLAIGFWFFTSSHIILIHDCTVMESFKEIFQFIINYMQKHF